MALILTLMRQHANNTWTILLLDPFSSIFCQTPHSIKIFSAIGNYMWLWIMYNDFAFCGIKVFTIILHCKNTMPWLLSFTRVHFFSSSKLLLTHDDPSKIFEVNEIQWIVYIDTVYCFHDWLKIWAYTVHTQFTLIQQSN